MAFVAVAATVGGAIGLGGTAAIIGGGALIGAGVGGAYSAITGDGNVLNSMLTGGLIGGAGAYGIGALGGGGAGVQAQMAGPFFGGATGTGTVGPAATAVQTASPAMTAANTAPTFAYTPAGEMVSSAYPAAVTGAQNVAGFVPPSPEGIGAIGKAATSGLTGSEKLALGLGATSLLSLIGSQNQSKLSSDTGTTPSYIRPYTYSSTQNQPGGPYPAPYATAQYDQAGNPVMDTRERDYFTQSFTAGEPYQAANGGLMAAYQSGGPVERMSQMNTAINPQGGMYPQGMIDKTQYAVPTQRPTSMEVIDAGAQRMFAKGGNVKGYAVGGMPDLGSGFSFGNLKPYKASLAEENAAIAFNQANGIKTVGGMGGYSPGSGPSMDPSPFYKQQSGMGGLSSMLNQPTGQSTFPGASSMQGGFGQGASGYPSFNMGYGGGGGNGGAFPLQGQYGIVKMAAGGNIQGYNLGGYSDGGRLLKGPGDGVSDGIPAVIGNRQPARLADGEFVIPARIVSELGNGSTDAGAKRLYAMMDKIQAGRKKTVGKGKVAVDSKARKHLPA